MPVSEQNFLAAVGEELARLNKEGTVEDVWQCLSLANYFDIKASENGQVSRKEVGRFCEESGISHNNKSSLGNRIYEAAFRMG